MTPHMLDFVRTFVWYAEIRGPVLDVGSYVEANQEYLDFRRAFPVGTSYLGVDVLAGPGVDRKMDLLCADDVGAVLSDFCPRVVLCLYVVEHVWDIFAAARALASMWQKSLDSWLFVATHQNQPYHGTDKYPDYWRLTASGLGRLMDEAGVPDSKVFVTPNTSNPEDVIAIRQLLSQSWPDEAMSKTVVSVEATTSVHWEQYR